MPWKYLEQYFRQRVYRSFFFFKETNHFPTALNGHGFCLDCNNKYTVEPRKKETIL